MSPGPGVPGSVPLTTVLRSAFRSSMELCRDSFISHSCFKPVLLRLLGALESSGRLKLLGKTQVVGPPCRVYSHVVGVGEACLSEVLGRVHAEGATV